MDAARAVRPGKRRHVTLAGERRIAFETERPRARGGGGGAARPHVHPGVALRESRTHGGLDGGGVRPRRAVELRDRVEKEHPADYFLPHVGQVSAERGEGPGGVADDAHAVAKGR